VGSGGICHCHNPFCFEQRGKIQIILPVFWVNVSCGVIKTLDTKTLELWVRRKPGKLVCSGCGRTVA
jgi:hypothetical protein